MEVINEKAVNNVSVADLCKSGGLSTMSHCTFKLICLAPTQIPDTREGNPSNWIDCKKWVTCLGFLLNCNKPAAKRKTYSVWNLHYFFPLLHRESDGSEKCIIQLATGETQMKPSNYQFSSRAKKQNVTEPASNLINALVWLHPFYWDNGKWC